METPQNDFANVKLDIAVDDRLTNCVDIIAASRTMAILLMRRDDQALRDRAARARYIGVVSTLAGALDAILHFEVDQSRANAGRLSRPH